MNLLRVTCAVLAGAVVAVAPAGARAADKSQWVTVDSAGATESLVTLNHEPGVTTGVRRIHTAPAGHDLRAPQWSPDGNRVVFAQSGPDGARVLVYDAPSGQVRELAPGATAPSWGPDGTRVAFVRGDALLTRLLDGSDEQALAIDGSGVRDVAWSPDGEWMALWVGDRLELASVDGMTREVVSEHASGGAAWAPDGASFVYSRTGEWTGLSRVWIESGAEAEVTYASGPARVDLEPDFAPSGIELIYTRHNAADGPPSLEIIRPGSLLVPGLPNFLQLSEADWQPCVAGVTASCESVTPLPPAPASPTCPASTPLTAVAGRRIALRPTCTGGWWLEIVDRPAHGGVDVVGTGIIGYRATPGYTGPDTFTYRVRDIRGQFSPVSRVDVIVVPPPPRPAAPKLTVARVPRLDRRGRVRLRGTCDRACTVRLRLRIKLHTGRTVDGRLVTGSAPAGGAVTLRLKRGKVPAGRRVVSVRIRGVLRGADGRRRIFSLKLRR